MNKKDIEKEISKFVDEIDTPYDLKEIEDKLDLKDNSYTLVKKEKKNPIIKHLMISLSAFSLGILVLVLVILIPKGNNNENGNGVITSNSTTTINSETTTAISDETTTIITAGDSTVSTNTKTHTTGAVAPTLMPTTTFSDPFESYFPIDINYIIRSEKLELNCEILFAQYYNEEKSEYILVIFSKDYIADYNFDISNTVTNEIYYSGQLDFVMTSNGFYSEISTKEYNNNIKIQASYLSDDDYIVLEDA